MVCPTSSLKFVGTFTLGLLTGVSYNLTSITLPSLALLPSAARARLTLSTIQERSTQHILTLASLSSLSLIGAYTLASPRNKHPYLLWTALMGFIGGQGVEYWYNGLSRFPSWRRGSSRTAGAGATISTGEGGYVEVGAEGSGEVNGEKVEGEMARERRVQGVRGLVAGVGFLMGVVGIWGDGA